MFIFSSTATFKDTYEGIAYPPKLPQGSPINILRVGICKSFPMTLCGKTTSEYGPDALVYEMSEQAYGNATLCNSKGFCPKGLMDMSPCYLGKFMFVIDKTQWVSVLSQTMRRTHWRAIRKLNFYVKSNEYYKYQSFVCMHVCYHISLQLLNPFG